MQNNMLTINNRTDFRQWLTNNHNIETECWVVIKRGRPVDDQHFWYLDAVEEALCFGWIDSTCKPYSGGEGYLQRFSPRQKKSPWTELNKERVRRLEKLGLMTDAGRVVLPDMDVANFEIAAEIQQALREAGAWESFLEFPPLYQRIRAYNVNFYKQRYSAQYGKKLQHLVDMTKQGKMYGQWNDYGRLPA